MKNPLSQKLFLKVENCRVLHNDIKQQLLFEISEIDRLIDSYKLLLKLTEEKEPDNIETAALATVLHSFYNGAEKLFLIILKTEQISLNKHQWYSELLQDMTTPTVTRKAVIS